MPFVFDAIESWDDLDDATFNTESSNDVEFYSILHMMSGIYCATVEEHFIAIE